MRGRARQGDLASTAQERGVRLARLCQQSADRARRLLLPPISATIEIPDGRKRLISSTLHASAPRQELVREMPLARSCVSQMIHSS